MRIQKRTFLELFFPLTVIAFLGQGTRFIDITHIANLRWLFLVILFFYLFLNRKLLITAPQTFCIALFLYLLWCVSTSLWSEVPSLSLVKSLLFMITVVTMISVGSLWVLRFGYQHWSGWLFFILIIILASGIFGGRANDQIGNVVLYGGLSGNPNNFGFLAAVVAPFILWRCYCVKTQRWLMTLWIFLFVIDIKFLFESFSRSSIATFMSILSFFVLSLPLSKKALIVFASIFFIIVSLLIMPIGSIESFVTEHFYKGGSTSSAALLNSRTLKWQNSYRHAIEGGVVGAGFSATIGDNHYEFTGLSNGNYGREKGNSQLAILEETGLVGFALYLAVLVLFFSYAIPYFVHMRGSEKVVMGLALGTITGLLSESLVEAWWDSLGPEVIVFWTMVGVVFGVVCLSRKGVYNF